MRRSIYRLGQPSFNWEKNSKTKHVPDTNTDFGIQIKNAEVTNYAQKSVVILKFLFDSFLPFLESEMGLIVATFWEIRNANHLGDNNTDPWEKT